MGEREYRIKKTHKVESFDPDDYIVAKCNKCGEEIGFFPVRVMFLSGCTCGNNGYGDPRDWKNFQFGNFSFVSMSQLTFRYPINFQVNRQKIV